MRTAETLRSEIAPNFINKISMPDAFDQRVQTDYSFRERIAGCTSVGFEHFKKGLTPHGMKLIPFGDPGEEKVYGMMTRDVMDKLFGRPYDEYGFGYPYDVTGLIKDNRSYGKSAAFLEVLHKHAIVPFKEIRYYTDELWQYFMQPDHGDLTTLLQSEEDKRETINDFVQRFGFTPTFLSNAETALRGRSGVQVIYEQSENFLEFLLANNVEEDEAADQSIMINESIPEKYILAVVALGEHEQSELAATFSNSNKWI